MSNRFARCAAAWAASSTVTFVLVTGSIASGATGEAPEKSEREAARLEALRDGWPDTPVGMVASAWVGAFAAGEETMRTFLEAHLAEGSLVERSMEERMTSYRRLRDRLGDLMLASVAESTPSELTVVLLADDASSHRFVFTVEEDEPHKLVSVGIVQYGHGHGHGDHPKQK